MTSSRLPARFPLLKPASPGIAEPDLGMPPKSSDLRSGDLCLRCQGDLLEYDSLFNLGCLKCGYPLARSFTG